MKKAHMVIIWRPKMVNLFYSLVYGTIFLLSVIKQIVITKHVLLDRKYTYKKNKSIVIITNNLGISFIIFFPIYHFHDYFYFN